MNRCILASCVPLLLLLATTAHAFTPVPLWSQRFGGTSPDEGKSVAVDGSGNVFVTGYFWDTANFGGGDLIASGGGVDIFLAKYDAAGNHLWSQRFGSTGQDAGYAVATDDAGNVYVTGPFSGTVNFGGGSLISAGGFDIFLAKYDASGFYQWSKRFGGTSDDIGNGVAVDPAGNVVITGSFAGTANFGGSNLTAFGGIDIFLAKYNTNGIHQWSWRFGSELEDDGRSVAIDGSGNVLMTGYFRNSVVFGGGGISSAGGRDIVLAKYNASGSPVWNQRFGNTSHDEGQSVAVDAAGNVILTGQVSGAVDFGGGVLAHGGADDVFVAKYASTGVHQWSHTFGGSSFEVGRGAATDAAGSVFVTGWFGNSINFGGGTLAALDTESFLVKFNSLGGHEWSRSFGAGDDDRGNSVAVDPWGNVLSTGYFHGVAGVGTGVLASAGFADIYLLKYSGATAEPTISSIADIGNDQGRKVKIRFARAGVDENSAANPVTRYVALRRDDAPPALYSETGPPAHLRVPLDNGWTEVGSVSAFAADSYGIDVPTIGDSTLVLGQYYSVFTIRAATALPGVFFDSPRDSGYSVDNLAPGIPGSLLYSRGVLSWNESPAEDFDYFTVYGASADDFGSATVVDYAVSPSMDVFSSPYVYYFVTATDFSGNEGDPISVNSASGVGGSPRSYVLSVSNFPNPFNPRTTVSYTVPSRGAVSVTIYDARGARVATLVDNEIREAGAYRLEWDGRADSGRAVSSGVYFARVHHNDAVRSKKLVLLK